MSDRFRELSSNPSIDVTDEVMASRGTDPVGDRAEKVLIEAVRNAELDAETRIHAMHGIAYSGSHYARDLIVELLEDGDPKVRAAAAMIVTSSRQRPPFAPGLF